MLSWQASRVATYTDATHLTFLTMHNSATRAALSQLSLASKLFIGVAFVHLFLFLPKGLVDMKVVFNLVWALSTLLCILGFFIANRHMGLTSEAAEFTEPRMIFGRRAERKARLSIVLGFYLSFMVPVLNLLIAVWTLVRIRLAVAAFERAAREARESEARRRSKFGPCGS